MWRIRRVARLGVFVDWGPAAAIGALSLAINLVDPPAGFDWLSVCILGSYALSVGLRRRAPVPLHLLVAIAGAVEILRTPADAHGSFEGFVALVLTANAVGAGTRSRAALALAIGAVLPQYVALYARGGLSNAVEFMPEIVWVGAAAGLGRAFQSRGRLVLLLEDKTVRLERERDERPRTAVADERRRIARELHDVVSHALSVTVIQAGAARRTLSSDVPGAERALLAVEDAGREALGEMRRLLTVLRADEPGESRTPSPGVAAIPALVDRVREAGLTVALTLEGADHPLPGGIDLVVYRVVQESLTNVMKHARGGRAWVAVRIAGDAVAVEVRDDGPEQGTPSFEPGHGLWGMRERVNLYGGSVEAAAQSTGFAVRVEIPLGGL